MERTRMTFLLSGLINFVFSLIVVGLLLRMLFRLLGANPSAEFTQFLYSSTTPLLSPFNGIFSPYVIEKGYVLEFSTLIAITVYALISWLLVEFINYVSYSLPDYSRRK